MKTQESAQTPRPDQDVDTAVSESTTIATSGTEQQQQQIEEQRKIIHRLLARQLEYYFSTANLAKDTYVSTLRSLNDGYVPVSILANFGKVQALAPLESALGAIPVAVADFSDLLEVVQIDAESGKRVSAADRGGNKKKAGKTVMAVGPISGEPIPMEQISTSLGGTAGTSTPVATPTSAASMATPTAPPTDASTGNVQNTVIIREAPEGTSEEVVRTLFEFDGCPSVESVHLDLQNCWYVRNLLLNATCFRHSVVTSH
jgi:hypothetical protein